MSLKRSNPTRTTSLSGGDAGGKVNRQDLFEDLQKRAENGSVFSAVDVALAIGAIEAQVARALLGLAAEGIVQKADSGRYRATGVVGLPVAEFLKAFTRASKLDGTRMRDLSEIDRLKKNNDVMRAKLMRGQAEAAHYLSLLQKHGIDPGVVPSNEALERAEARVAANEAAPAGESNGAGTPTDDGAVGEEAAAPDAMAADAGSADKAWS